MPLTYVFDTSALLAFFSYSGRQWYKDMAFDPESRFVLNALSLAELAVQTNTAYYSTRTWADDENRVGNEVRRRHRLLDVIYRRAPFPDDDGVVFDRVVANDADYVLLAHQRSAAFALMEFDSERFQGVNPGLADHQIILTAVRIAEESPACLVTRDRGMFQAADRLGVDVLHLNA